MINFGVGGPGFKKFGINMGGNKDGFYMYGQTVVQFNNPDKPSSSYPSDSGSGISEADLDNLGRTQGTNNGYNGAPIYEKAILGGGPGSKFFSTDFAAMDFGIRYNDNSISRALEFGTAFYSFTESGVTYHSYVLPIVGFASDVSVPLGSPWGTTFEGVGHTHGYGTGFEEFSDIDKSTPYYNYLCTPNGALYRYDARTRSITVITRDLPNMNNFQNYQWNEMDQGRLNFWKLLLWRF